MRNNRVLNRVLHRILKLLNNCTGIQYFMVFHGASVRCLREEMTVRQGTMSAVQNTVFMLSDTTAIADV